MKRKIIAAALGMSLLFSTVTTTFADGEWWRDGFNYVYYHNPKIMELDQPEGVFHPYREVSRYEVAEALWKLEGSPDESGSRFLDAERNNPAISYVNNSGIMNGVDERHFDPDGPITREQMATIAYRFAKACGYDTKFPARVEMSFDDVGYVSDYAYGAVAWVTDVGLMTGTGSSFEPKAFLNRGQIATIILRLADLVGGAPEKVVRSEVSRTEASESRRVGKAEDKSIFIDNLGWLLRQTNTGVVEVTYRSSDDSAVINFGDNSSARVSINGLSYAEIVVMVTEEAMK